MTEIVCASCEHCCGGQERRAMAVVMDNSGSERFEWTNEGQERARA